MANTFMIVVRFRLETVAGHPRRFGCGIPEAQVNRQALNAVGPIALTARARAVSPSAQERVKDEATANTSRRIAKAVLPVLQA